jgi:hypothetical protein
MLADREIDRYEFSITHLAYLLSAKNEQKIKFDVLTAVVMKSSVFWDITPYSLLKINQHLRGICYLYLQGRRIRQARSHCEAGRKQSQAELCLLSCLEDGGDMFLRNVG